LLDLLISESGVPVQYENELIFFTAPEDLTGPGVCVPDPALPCPRVDCRFLEHLEIGTLILDIYGN
jgi:hypothetical protein